MPINGITKPAGPTYILNAGSAQARDLLFWAPTGASGGVQDPVQGLVVPTLAGTTPILTQGGPAIDCSGNNLGLRTAAPASLCGLLPVSLMVVFWQSNAGTTGGLNPKYLHISFTSTDTTPFSQYSLQVDTNIKAQWNTAGASASLASATVPATAALHVGILSLATGAQALYLDGVSVATSAVAVSTPTFITPQVCIGCATSDITTRTCGALILDARVYGRALSAQDALDFSASWNDLYLRTSAPTFQRKATAFVPSRPYLVRQALHRSTYF